jgi:hypothetical protein
MTVTKMIHGYFGKVLTLFFIVELTELFSCFNINFNDRRECFLVGIFKMFKCGNNFEELSDVGIESGMRKHFIKIIESDYK